METAPVRGAFPSSLPARGTTGEVAHRRGVIFQSSVPSVTT